jgi:polyhydroxyalkanoate synthesis regulator phasin
MPRVGSDELAALAAQGTLLAPEASGLASRLFEPPAVYLATLALAVRSVRERMDEAIAIAEELGGHVSSQDEATLVVRVPAGRFREALDRVERLGDVLVRRVAVQEPSERLRDLRARIRSASELRERLQRLASRAANASEAIAIQREIERLTQAIELLEGELASLEDRVLFSTIAVSFQAPSMLEEQPVARERFGLPFPWLDQLGLPRLLGLY